MDLSKVSTENLKKLRIYPDFRDDPLFKGVMQILKNDRDIRSENWKVPTTFRLYAVLSFGGALGGLIPQVIYFLVAVIYSYNEWNFGSFGSKFLLLAFSLISAGVNWFLANEHDNYGYDKRINSIIVVITYILLRFFHTKIFFTLLISMAIQSLISAVFYYFTTVREMKKETEETYVAVKKTQKKIAEAEEFFEKTYEVLKQRVALCNAELQRRGVAPVYPLGNLWWEKRINWTIALYGDLFNDEHCARYKSYASYDEYDLKTRQVAGTTEHEFTLQVHKEFFMFEIPKHKNADIFAQIKEKKFQCLFSRSINDFDVNTCDIIALGCKWTKYDSDKSQTTMRVSPTQSQIDDARRRINSNQDANERLHNAYYRGAALTHDEMFWATGGKGVSWQDQMISDNKRRNDLDKFIKNNTYDDVTYDSSTRKSDNSAVFMYIINGVVFYTNEPPLCYISNKYTLENSSKWIGSREVEIEAAILHLILHEPKISRVVVGNIWNSFGEKEENEEIYAKVLHEFVTSEMYEKHFKK